MPNRSSIPWRLKALASDMNLMKNIAWKERYNHQLRADAFNVFNHRNFGVPSASISNPTSIGVVSSTAGEARTI